MDLGLGGKVALVAGASRGIGFATALELAREGAAVAICSRNAESVARAADALRAAGGEVLGIPADLSTTDGIGAAVAAVQGWRDRVDVLVTNTGGPPTWRVLEAPWQAWQETVDLLLRSVVELARAFVPGMQARKWGRVIGITSFAVKQPVPGLVLTNGIRAAVTGYYRTLAEEIARDGVTVNTVLPGFTETERLTSLADANGKRAGESRQAVYDRWLASTPAARFGRADEVAAMIAFLASDRAGFVTGQAICVDGGVVKALL